MSELSKVALQVDSNQSFPNNNNGYITPAILRSYNTNVIDSTVNQTVYTADSGSWNSKIGILNGQTGSYATTGSNAFIGNQTISGNQTITGNQVVTGNLTASFFSGDGSGMTNLPAQIPLTPLNDFTASQDIKNSSLETYTGSIDTKFTTLGSTTSSFSSSIGQLNSFTSSQATKNTTLGYSTSSLNAYTQSLITAFTASGTTITVNGTTTLKSNLYVTGGVYQNVVPVTIASQTASLDLTQGTYFTLTLADNVTTHIKPTNLAGGVSAALVITTGTNSAITLASTMLQPSGSSYSPSNGIGKIDILSLVGTNASNIFVVSTKNLI
jgi:hypothetical protein